MGDDRHNLIDRRGFLRRALAGIMAAGAAALTASGVRQAFDLEIERISARSEHLTQTLRVAFASDLHVGPYANAERVEHWVGAILTTHPDVIVLGGDIVDQRAPHDLRPVFAALAELRAPAGVFAVLGNHEYLRFTRPQRFLDDLHGIGITPLVNEGRTLPGGLFLAGVDDYRHGRPDLARSLAARPARAPALLVSHNPDLLPSVPHTVDLTLCGHTHGGQLRLPAFGPLFTSSAYGTRFVSGWIDAPARGYVSRGLGVGKVPIRWNCPPELTLLTLLPADAPARHVRPRAARAAPQPHRDRLAHITYHAGRS